MRKVILFLLALVLISSIVFADIGPKPTVVFDFTHNGEPLEFSVTSNSIKNKPGHFALANAQA